MINKIKNPKKGVAIELAIVAIIIVFSLSALLVSLAVVSNSVGKKSLDSLTEKTELSQIAKSYLDDNNQNGVYENGNDTEYNSNYTITISDYDYNQKQFIFTKNNGKYKLTVIVRPTKNNDVITNNKIVTWSYSLI